MQLTERCALRKWHFLRKARFYRQLPFSLFLHGNCSVYLLSGGFKHMPSYSQPYSYCSILFQFLHTFFAFTVPLQTALGNSRFLQLTEQDSWRRKEKRQYKYGFKKAALTQDGHPEVEGYRWDPRVHMRCPFRGRVFTFFSSVLVTGTQFPVPPGMVWREPGLKCNLVLRRGSSQEYCRNLGLRFSNPLFWTRSHSPWKQRPTMDVLLNSGDPSFISFFWSCVH